MIKAATIGLLLLCILFLSPVMAQASYVIASSGIASMTISKTVLNPQKNTYIHSLGLSDAMYHPGDTVTFHITLSNTGNISIPEVLVKDTLPSFLTLSSGPGDLDKSTNTLSFVAYNIAAHTTQTFAVSAKIADASGLPTNQGIVCTANKASAKGTNTQVVNDTSSFCIQKSLTQAAPAQVKSTPATGPEALPLLGLLGSGTFGFFLRKKSK